VKHGENHGNLAMNNEEWWNTLHLGMELWENHGIERSNMDKPEF
jgi:hypothetical protein